MEWCDALSQIPLPAGHRFCPAEFMGGHPGLIIKRGDSSVAYLWSDSAVEIQLIIAGPPSLMDQEHSRFDLRHPHSIPDLQQAIAELLV